MKIEKSTTGDYFIAHCRYDGFDLMATGVTTVMCLYKMFDEIKHYTLQKTTIGMDDDSDKEREVLYSPNDY